MKNPKRLAVKIGKQVAVHLANKAGEELRALVLKATGFDLNELGIQLEDLTKTLSATQLKKVAANAGLNLAAKMLGAVAEKLKLPGLGANLTPDALSLAIQKNSPKKLAAKVARTVAIHLARKALDALSGKIRDITGLDLGHLGFEKPEDLVDLSPGQLAKEVGMKVLQALVTQVSDKLGLKSMGVNLDAAELVEGIRQLKNGDKTLAVKIGKRLAIDLAQHASNVLVEQVKAAIGVDLESPSRDFLKELTELHPRQLPAAVGAYVAQNLLGATLKKLGLPDLGVTLTPDDFAELMKSPAAFGKKIAMKLAHGAMQKLSDKFEEATGIPIRKICPNKDCTQLLKSSPGDVAKSLAQQLFSTAGGNVLREIEERTGQSLSHIQDQLVGGDPLGALKSLSMSGLDFEAILGDHGEPWMRAMGELLSRGLPLLTNYREFFMEKIPKMVKNYRFHMVRHCVDPRGRETDCSMVDGAVDNSEDTSKLALPEPTGSRKCTSTLYTCTPKSGESAEQLSSEECASLRRDVDEGDEDAGRQARKYDITAQCVLDLNGAAPGSDAADGDQCRTMEISTSNIMLGVINQLQKLASVLSRGTSNNKKAGILSKATKFLCGMHEQMMTQSTVPAKIRLTLCNTKIAPWSLANWNTVDKTSSASLIEMWKTWRKDDYSRHNAEPPPSWVDVDIMSEGGGEDRRYGQPPPPPPSLLEANIMSEAGGEADVGDMVQVSDMADAGDWAEVGDTDIPYESLDTRSASHATVAEGLGDSGPAHGGDSGPAYGDSGSAYGDSGSAYGDSGPAHGGDSGPAYGDSGSAYGDSVYADDFAASPSADSTEFRAGIQILDGQGNVLHDEVYGEPGFRIDLRNSLGAGLFEKLALRPDMPLPFGQALSQDWSFTLKKTDDGGWKFSVEMTKLVDALKSLKPIGFLLDALENLLFGEGSKGKLKFGFALAPRGQLELFGVSLKDLYHRLNVDKLFGIAVGKAKDLAKKHLAITGKDDNDSFLAKIRNTVLGTARKGLYFINQTKGVIDRFEANIKGMVRNKTTEFKEMVWGYISDAEDRVSEFANKTFDQLGAKARTVQGKIASLQKGTAGQVFGHVKMAVDMASMLDSVSGGGDPTANAGLSQAETFLNSLKSIGKLLGKAIGLLVSKLPQGLQDSLFRMKNATVTLFDRAKSTAQDSKVSRFFKKIVDGAKYIKEKLYEMLPVVKQIFADIKESVVDILTTGEKGVVQASGKVQGGITKVFNTVRTKLNGVWVNVTHVVEEAFTKIHNIKSEIYGVVDGYLEPVTTVLGNMENWINWIGEEPEALVDIIRDMAYKSIDKHMAKIWFMKPSLPEVWDAFLPSNSEAVCELRSDSDTDE